MNDEEAQGATIIDGRAAAATVQARVAREVARLKAEHGLTPGLAAVLVGDDPASAIYVRNKARRAGECGMHVEDTRLPASTAQESLLALIGRLNTDSAVHGILVQLPLPGGLDAAPVIAAIDPAKDVDGLHVVNAGRLASGRLTGPEAALVPATPLGVMILLRQQLGALAGRRALVLGRSSLVGRPLAQLLVHADCTVTVAHSKTRDLKGECRRAEILVAATGRAEMVRGDWIAPGATVIDVGTTRVPAPTPEKPDRMRLAGDVAFAEARRVAGAITPVPGGVGPMTIACLLVNTLTACCRQNGVTPPDPAFLD